MHTCRESRSWCLWHPHWRKFSHLWHRHARFQCAVEYNATGYVDLFLECHIFDWVRLSSEHSRNTAWLKEWVLVVLCCAVQCLRLTRANKWVSPSIMYGCWDHRRVNIKSSGKIFSGIGSLKVDRVTVRMSAIWRLCSSVMWNMRSGRGVNVHLLLNCNHGMPATAPPECRWFRRNSIQSTYVIC